MKHLISLKDASRGDIQAMLDIAGMLKNKKAAGETPDYLKNKTLIMLFEKTSTRTRLSFEAAMTELGGHAIFVDRRTTQLALTDFSVEMQAIMRFGDVLMYRAKRAADILTAARLNRIPVIDGCSEKYHPAQALSDLLTMKEYSGGLEKIKKVVWLGIENNVSNTLALACVKMGIEVVIVAPEVDEDSVDDELYDMLKASGKVKRTLNLKEALRGADYVHTDTWMNMEFFENGRVKSKFRKEYERRKKVFVPYQLSANLIARNCPNAKIMHCMPCHFGYEIDRRAFDHPNSIILDQAESRLHMQKAILVWLLK